MKNTLIRAFVIVIALSGVASTAYSKTTKHVLETNVSALPVPMCPWNDPKGCGID